MSNCTTAEHEATKRDERAWSALLFVGVQDLGDGEWAELRNCPCCLSTLAVPVRLASREG